MPSVEMRCSTRVFVPKAKDGELVRVLRSGRRLWVESADVKHRGSKTGDDWYPLINDSGKECKKHKINGWHSVDDVGDSMDIDVQKPVSEIGERVASLRDESGGGGDNVKSEYKMFKNVYSRKRKKFNGRRFDDCDTKKFGLHFVRRQRRKVGQVSHVKEKCGDDEQHDRGSLTQRFTDDDDLWPLTVVVESSCVGCCLISSMLSTLLRYIGKDRIGLDKLSTFLLSRPISPVFASSGIHILWNRPSVKTKGFCRIFGVRQLITMFTVDYMVAPHCFLHLHATMLFRSVRLSSFCWINFHRIDESTDEPLPYVNDQSESFLSSLVTPAITDVLKDVKSVNSSPGPAKSSNRNAQTRIGVLTRSSSKRRRRSLRSRRARNPLHFVLQKSSGSPIPANRAGLKKNSTALPNQELRRSVRKSITSEIPVQKSIALGVNIDIDSQSCFANILVVETDKCYRVDGAEVALEASSSNEWLLAVRKDGSTRYHFKVQKEMRLGTTNRYTHAVIWAGENGWKLEFPERKDWAVFKELYKVCGERNIVPTSPVVKIIPVPKVCEVTYLRDSPGAFKRPESYIKMNSDELSRTLSRRTANYDMDSDDEEWLGKFNSELDDASNRVSDGNFELMIDAFEKASYYNSEDLNDEKAAASLCLEIASTEVAESIYRYWAKKRKQKRGPLNRVFQLNQPTRAQLITKPVLRKKRSLKRPYVQPLQQGRGKDSTVLQVIAAEHNAAEEQSAYYRVQEAKASADKTAEVAILKRQKAQFLMENADLAMYRATMALRIADAATGSLDHQLVADNFLDEKGTEL